VILVTFSNQFCHVGIFYIYGLNDERIVMNIESLREYCISKKSVTESFPFDEETLVFKASGKIFALVSLEGDLNVNLKCNPALAIELRERYPSVIPGYHMNKKHWNTVIVDGSIPDKEIFSWIDHSYDLVMKK
jgi:predicted DNA-binding protein (MmcQ/YjbR family)